MPNQPKTPARSVRVGDELWEASKAVAAKRDETVTDVIVRALREYVMHEMSESLRVEWEQGMARQAMDSGQRHVDRRRSRLASEMPGWIGNEPPPDVLTEDDSWDRWPA